jgi:hypothetical protein
VPTLTDVVDAIVEIKRIGRSTRLKRSSTCLVLQRCEARGSHPPRRQPVRSSGCCRHRRTGNSTKPPCERPGYVAFVKLPYRPVTDSPGVVLGSLRRRVHLDGYVVHLSAQQAAVLWALMARDGRGWSAALCWRQQRGQRPGRRPLPAGPAAGRVAPPSSAELALTRPVVPRWRHRLPIRLAPGSGCHASRP